MGLSATCIVRWVTWSLRCYFIVVAPALLFGWDANQEALLVCRVCEGVFSSSSSPSSLVPFFFSPSCALHSPSLVPFFFSLLPHMTQLQVHYIHDSIHPSIHPSPCARSICLHLSSSIFIPLHPHSTPFPPPVSIPAPSILQPPRPQCSHASYTSSTAFPSTEPATRKTKCRT